MAGMACTGAEDQPRWVRLQACAFYAGTGFVPHAVPNEAWWEIEDSFTLRLVQSEGLTPPTPCVSRNYSKE